MNTQFRKLIFNYLTILSCVILLTSCNMGSAINEPKTTPQTTSESDKVQSTPQSNIKVESTIDVNSITYDENDYYTSWKTGNETYINLKGETASIDGTGALSDKNNITINKSGVYVLSGKLNNGQVVVDLENNDKELVKLVLNNAELNCNDSSPIYVKNSKKTVISLPEGTKNIVTDGKTYSLPDSSSDEPNASIFSKSDLTINGAGALTVNGNYNNGITSKDDLKITGGNIDINSKDDGLMGKDLVIVKDGKITITALGDGIKSTNDSDSSKGFIGIESGTFDITSSSDGLQAYSSIIIKGGDFTIKSGGGNTNGVAKTGNKMNKMKGMGRNLESVNPDDKASAGIPASGNSTSNSTSNKTSEEENSSKSLKASDINIMGGNFNIDSWDDSIHSNNTIKITDGDFNILSGDDGIHADSSIEISGGNINIKNSYEGIESTLVSISGGKINLISKDDGINISGGNDGSSMNGRPGQNTFKASEDQKLVISGGEVTVDADGDGLDANGSIYMNGGTVIVNGPTSNGNGALDYDGVFEITSGMLVASGSAGMTQGPSQNSTQYSIVMNFSSLQKAGTIFHLKDSNGKAIITYSPTKDYQSVVISSPDLKKDGNYTLYSGGTSTGTSQNGVYNGGIYKEGTKIVDFTISSITTWLSESGVTTNQGGSFNGGRRGFKPQDGEFNPQDGQPMPPNGEFNPNGRKNRPVNGEFEPQGDQMIPGGDHRPEDGQFVPEGNAPQNNDNGVEIQNNVTGQL